MKLVHLNKNNEVTDTYIARVNKKVYGAACRVIEKYKECGDTYNDLSESMKMDGLTIYEHEELNALLEQFFNGYHTILKNDEGMIEWDFADEVEELNNKYYGWVYQTSFIFNDEDIDNNAYKYTKLEGALMTLKDMTTTIANPYLKKAVQELKQLPKGDKQIVSTEELIKQYPWQVMVTDDDGKTYIIAWRNFETIDLYVKNYNFKNFI